MHLLYLRVHIFYCDSTHHPSCDGWPSGASWGRMLYDACPHMTVYSRPSCDGRYIRCSFVIFYYKRYLRYYTLSFFINFIIFLKNNLLLLFFLSLPMALLLLLLYWPYQAKFLDPPLPVGHFRLFILFGLRCIKYFLWNRFMCWKRTEMYNNWLAVTEWKTEACNCMS